MPDIDKIIAYEQGELSDDDTVELFQSMVDDGSAWQLQGHYGRTAAALLKQGLINLPEEKTNVRRAEFQN